ncbi:MAG: DUF6456 domain-containing protein [Hyphomonadaceae bacterium]
MSARRVARVLARLASTGAELRLDGAGPNYGVFTNRDRRRRAVLRLSASETRALESEGLLVATSDGVFTLSAAGTAKLARDAAADGEGFLAQHGEIQTREVIDADGSIHRVRGLDPEGALRRLAAMRGPNGAPWLSQAELAVASKLRADWALGEIGLVRNSDWMAAPMGSSARGPGNAQEAALARRCDARRRLADALARLAAPLRRVVERVCLMEEGLEALERAEGWPARSGKLALKLGLAQLAAEL